MDQFRSYLLNGVAALLLGGCQALGPGGGKLNFHAGSILMLNEPITLPARQAHVNLQQGTVVDAVNNYEVNCEFRFRNLGPQVIQPGRFVVRRAGDGEEWFSPPYVRRFYKVLYLKSDQYPDVMTLECQVFDEPNPGRWISVPDMQQALGKYFSFEF